MLMFLLAVTSTGFAPSQVVDRMADADLAAAGLTVELVAPPRSMSGHDFSAKLVAASGIISRSPGDSVDDGTRTRYGAGAASVWGKDGRSVVVYYQPTSTTDAGKVRVCRIFARRVASFDLRWPAIRWCHARLGYSTPVTPPPLD
jgi:hypothetical protein